MLLFLVPLLLLLLSLLLGILRCSSLVDALSFTDGGGDEEETVLVVVHTVLQEMKPVPVQRTDFFRT